MAGDFSTLFDEIGQSHTQQFMTLDTMAVVKHHLSVPTWYHNYHSLDVITVADSSLCPVISYSILSPSDHCHTLCVFNMFFNSLV
jgi:hypothetical protein